ncbi:MULTISPECIES: AI-2E family transporter [Streptosporangium]|uniref:PurR-regulated permease PerM n=1 Tax=Streptosporangium brasiliense TaxID=47480 RepID=A0ABT9RA56_9ACTN|nr:AI-2E family transporter [Streptosporangium brasiliense]MDP9866141.1 putative PurR-regulated permease PerM [Streptosporangium brasiliense]
MGEASGSAGFSRGFRLVIGLAAAVVALAGVRAVADIAGPAFLALVLTVAVSPLRVWLRRRGARPWVLVTVPLLTVLLLLVALVGALVVSVAQLVALLPSYAGQYQRLLDSIAREIDHLGITQEQVRSAMSKLDPGSLIGLVQSFLGGLFGVGSALVLITLLLFGMSLDATAAHDAVRSLRASRPHMVGALGEFARGTCNYLIVSTVFGLIVAVLDAIALWIMGVPLPLLWGLLALITNYIPNIGFVLGLLPPALLALLDSGPGAMVAVVAVYSVLNFVIQSLIQPKFTGESAGLSTTVTILSLLVWTYVLGALGAILAVPLSALARALLLDSDPVTRWAIPLVSGRTAGRP